jgi:hypothetical protein
VGVVALAAVMIASYFGRGWTIEFVAKHAGTLAKVQTEERIKVAALQNLAGAHWAKIGSAAIAQQN